MHRGDAAIQAVLEMAGEVAVGVDAGDLAAQQVVLIAGGGRDGAAGGQGHFGLNLFDDLVEAVVAGGRDSAQ